MRVLSLWKDLINQRHSELQLNSILLHKLHRASNLSQPVQNNQTRIPEFSIKRRHKSTRFSQIRFIIAKGQKLE
jgi:hypothetical protein